MLSTFVHPAAAQEVYGTLLRLDSGAPAAGVVVTAALVANDSTVARAVTGARGTYVLRVPSAPIVLRVLRVGQQPYELARITLAPGERHDASATLPNVPVRLATFDQRVDTRCRVDPVNRTLVAQLFDEARKALWASQLAVVEDSATALFQHVVRRFDSRERLIGTPVVSQGEKRSMRPFAATNVDSLLQYGFRYITADNTIIYYAPDAEVLTSDRFLSHYCLRLNTDSVTHPKWRGVSFEPARTRRGVVQVRGTVWLDRETNELRRIDYGYSGLEPSLSRATPGGVVEYTVLDEGIWFVHEWMIRMPVLARFSRRGGDQTLDFFALHGVQITSGQVLELHDGENLIFSAGVSSDTAAAALVAPLLEYRDPTECDTLPVIPERPDTLSTLSGILRDAAGKPVAGVLVRATWVELEFIGDSHLRTSKLVERERELFTHTGIDGVFHLCDLPRKLTLTIVAGPPERSYARTAMRIGLETRHATVALIARADRLRERE
jgi:hypothetical protein